MFQDGEIKVAWTIKHTKREVIYYHESRQSAFQYVTLNKKCVFSAKETHFIGNLNDRETFDIKGDDNDQFGDVVHTNQGTTTITPVGGGSRPGM